MLIVLKKILTMIKGLGLSPHGNYAYSGAVEIYAIDCSQNGMYVCVHVTGVQIFSYADLRSNMMSCHVMSYEEPFKIGIKLLIYCYIPAAAYIVLLLCSCRYYNVSSLYGS